MHRPCEILTLNDLTHRLRSCDRPLSIDELREFVRGIILPPQEWKALLRFDPEEFCYQTLFESAWFELNLIGWKPGQFSSIHDHRGTACCVLVLDGTLTNRDFQRDATGNLTELSSFELQPGDLLCRENQQIHSCGNEASSLSDLATLHLYSPPLAPLTQRRHD
ncbi:cysteine dioxygenase [Rubinisphaera margarita]|uniref:cysteine dioxygenase n=1 Tax=Rubinisphaera margarita TaxID=2909586 RepID=UPI001EE94EEB|nr:cysteine dioxygenase family protein [Rubinisphaera margarita]MCG6158023.1 cysteine dioxygenase family protein [Rubinisphaera margarita]